MGTFNFPMWVSGVDSKLNGISSKQDEFARWSSNVHDRITAMESFMKSLGKKQSGIPNDQTGMVLKRGYEVLDNDMSNVKLAIKELKKSADDRLLLRSEVSGLTRRLEDLGAQVGMYDEIVQGVAIRPERAVPSIRIDRNTGASYVNPIKVHTKTFTLASTPRRIVIPAGNSTQVSFLVQPDQNQEGDLELFFLELANCTSTSFRVRILHNGIQQYLSNAPVHALSTFGNMNAGAQPFQMYESIFLEPGVDVTVELTDFSGADNTVELVAHGRRFLGYAVSGMDRRDLINVFSRNTWPFWFTSDEPVLLGSTIGATTPFNMTLKRQYHFEAAKSMQFGTVGGVSAPLNYTLKMNEGSAGNLILDDVPVNTWSGNGNFPFPFPEPYLALRGTFLNCVATARNAIVGQVSDIVWHGRAIPLTFPGQRSLEPLLEGRDVLINPASNKDLAIPRVVSR